jgi:hypothetical protein
LVRFFASRQRNEQPANHAVREELAMFLSFDNTNTMVYLSLKYRYYRFYKVFGGIILAFSIIMSLISLIADEGVPLGIEVKPHFYGAFMAVVMTSLIFINVGKLELKKDRLNTLMFLRGLKNE